MKKVHGKRVFVVKLVPKTRVSVSEEIKYTHVLNYIGAEDQ